jgi:hypothetical protein
MSAMRPAHLGLVPDLGEDQSVKDERAVYETAAGGGGGGAWTTCRLGTLCGGLYWHCVDRCCDSFNGVHDVYQPLVAFEDREDAVELAVKLR